MAEQILKTKFKFRKDTLANWTTNKAFVLLDGEPGVVVDSANDIVALKIGDGITTWENLKFINIYDDDIIISDVTTNDATVLKHGFLPKLEGSTDKYLRADGSWAVLNFATNEEMIAGVEDDVVATPKNTKSALDLKADLASPSLTGIPTAPTAAAGTNNTQVATTAYADAKVADSLADGVTGIAPSQNAVVDALGLKADLISPTLTGTPLAPTATAGTNNTQIATTAYADAKVADSLADGITGIAPSQNAVVDALALKADLASPTLTGIPLAPTAVAGTNNTQVATTAYADAKVAESITDGVTGIAPSQNVVFDALSLKANLESPSLTGTPTAPNQTAGDNSNKIANTKYVKDEVTRLNTPAACSKLATLDQTVFNYTTEDGWTDDAISVLVFRSGVFMTPDVDYDVDMVNKTITFVIPCSSIEIITTMFNNNGTVALQSKVKIQYADVDLIWSDSPTSNVVYFRLSSDGGITWDDAITLPSSEALSLKANLESPIFTGSPLAPTQTAGDNSTKIATTAYVKEEIIRLSTPISNTKLSTLDQTVFTYTLEDGWNFDTDSVLIFRSGIFMTPTVDYTVDMENKTITFLSLCEEDEIITAIFNNRGATPLTNNLDSPAFTGIPTAPTAEIGTNTNQIATTAFVTEAVGEGGGGSSGGGVGDLLYLYNTVSGAF